MRIRAHFRRTDCQGRKSVENRWQAPRGCGDDARIAYASRLGARGAMALMMPITPPRSSIFCQVCRPQYGSLLFIIAYRHASIDDATLIACLTAPEATA